MTDTEIDEALAGPLPTESHDEWLAKIERADKWLDHETKMAVANYHAADTNERRLSAKAEIKALSEQHFDIRHKSRDLEVLRLEERLREIRAAIAKRNESKDLIVQVRLSVLLGEIEWDDWALPRKSGDRLNGYSSVGSASYAAPASTSAYMPATNTPRSGPALRGSGTRADPYVATHPPGVQLPGPGVPTVSTNAAVPPSPLSDPAAVGAPPEEASSDGRIDSEPAETGEAIEETATEEGQASE